MMFINFLSRLFILDNIIIITQHKCCVIKFIFINMLKYNPLQRLIIAIQLG
ncbi:hypothetical protein EHF_0906 [Ehrlichia japonica]|uniref:Uncharacterized protein n=1 Tax=Ehrlichia japonica TaxID=391036 RepID=X5H3N9_9RICK|nr:hypothetical protein EHF_0906 [Ehrlichia japonica]